jgi:hypothetical protein
VLATWNFTVHVNDTWTYQNGANGRKSVVSRVRIFPRQRQRQRKGRCKRQRRRERKGRL